MSPEKWKEVIGNIKDNFEVFEHDSEHLEEMGGVDIEFITFKSPGLGKIKLEFVSQPVVIDKKTNYSRRIGSDTKVEYIYSQDEKSYKLNAYKWNEEEGEWTEISSASFVQDD